MFGLFIYIKKVGREGIRAIDATENRLGMQRYNERGTGRAGRARHIVVRRC